MVRHGIDEHPAVCNSSEIPLPRAFLKPLLGAPYKLDTLSCESGPASPGLIATWPRTWLGRTQRHEAHFSAAVTSVPAGEAFRRRVGFANPANISDPCYRAACRRSHSEWIPALVLGGDGTGHLRGAADRNTDRVRSWRSTPPHGPSGRNLLMSSERGLTTSCRRARSVEEPSRMLVVRP